MTALPLPQHPPASARQLRAPGHGRAAVRQSRWSNGRRFAGRAILAVFVASALLVASAVAVSPSLGFHYVPANAASPVLERGELGVFEPVQAGALRRGDVVRFISPATGDAEVRVISAFTSDHSAAVTRPDANSPADPGLVPATALQQRLRFSIPVAGYAATWLEAGAGQFSVALAAASARGETLIAAPTALAAGSLAVAIILLIAAAIVAIHDRRNPVRRQTRPRLRKIQLETHARTAGSPAETRWDGIVTQLQQDETKPVRLSRRRQRPQDSSTAEDPAVSSAARDSAQAVAGPDGAAVAASTAPPLTERTAATSGAADEHRTTPAGATRNGSVAPEPPPPHPTPPAMRDPAPLPAPSSLFTIPLRGQSTANDARAERLVRQVRGELDQLRQTLAELSLDHGDMMHVDAAAVAANPEAALSLPPSVLVRTIVAAHACSVQAEAHRKHQARRLAKLRSRVRKFAIEDAETRGRLGTLEEVISALHANLEDLRLDRGQPHVADAPALPQAALAAQRESSTGQSRALPAAQPEGGGDA